MSEFIATLASQYHWQAALIVLAGVIILTKLINYLAFLNPSLQRMREINKEQDRKKIAQEKYPPVMKASRNIGLITNLAFFILILPFCVTLELDKWWMVIVNSFIILMVYDFFYYLCHRFWFHGNGWMRRIHAVHHQARKPTYIDAFYVHPVETFVGIALFLGSLAILAAFLGPFHVSTAIITYVLFTQLNTLNHTFVDLPFPFKTVSWITAKHHIHHENMHKGNYATITLLYDKLFGTLD
ncbi:sterol desaturase family protein [Parahaliea sp. F7430]|uniref:Sterol desaturase family protein n=1 Tax=Sediminihaliea albiluteola TaxID=2758564 RepID=A0A7W2TXD8_9GAMM|nr:sterol desaturase family protein [Sediminihaliea albiluteola]MBA6413685.1 sterol desaturase family protein [Sediminihaliea albiluteola]